MHLNAIIAQPPAVIVSQERQRSGARLPGGCEGPVWAFGFLDLSEIPHISTTTGLK